MTRYGSETNAIATHATTSEDLASTQLPRLEAMRYLMSLVTGTLVAAILIAAALLVADRASWWKGFTAAGVAGAASLLVSSTIVLPLFRRDTGSLAYGFLAAGAVRAAVFGAVIVIAIRNGGYPENATVTIGGILYAAIVSIEGLVLFMLTRPTSVSQIHPTQDRA